MSVEALSALHAAARSELYARRFRITSSVVIASVPISRVLTASSVFPNQPNLKGLWFTNERAFLCECKNWNVAAGAPELIAFLHKMKQRNCKFGVFVSNYGITGDATALTAANDVVAGALSEGYEIIVLDWDDLVSIRSAKALVQRMQERWTRLKSYRTSV